MKRKVYQDHLEALKDLSVGETRNVRIGKHDVLIRKGQETDPEVKLLKPYVVETKSKVIKGPKI